MTELQKQHEFTLKTLEQLIKALESMTKDCKDLKDATKKEG